MVTVQHIGQGKNIGAYEFLIFWGGLGQIIEGNIYPHSPCFGTPEQDSNHNDPYTTKLLNTNPKIRTS